MIAPSKLTARQPAYQFRGEHIEVGEEGGDPLGVVGCMRTRVGFRRCGNVQGTIPDFHSGIPEINIGPVSDRFNGPSVALSLCICDL